MPLYSVTPSTIEFNEAFAKAGSYTTATCEYCGRKHFVQADKAGDYNEGEYAELLKCLEEQPDSYIISNNPIPYGYLDGKVFIPTCPCNAGGTYENFLLNSRDNIKDYFLNMTDKAESRMKEFSEVAESIKPEQ